MARTLYDLLEKLPFGPAAGLRFWLLGPGFFLRGDAFDNSDYKHLLEQFNSECGRCLSKPKFHRDLRETGIKIDLASLQESDRPRRSSWIFQ